MTRAPAAAALWIAVATGLAASSARGTLPEQLRTPEPKTGISEGVDVVERLGEPVPGALEFRDARGNRLQLRDALAGGKPVVLTLVYFRCPMLCSLVLNGLWPGTDYRAITVSFDPGEGPERALRHQEALLRALGEGHPSDWHFLTGAEPQLRALADSVGFKYRWDESNKQFAHPAAVFVLTPEGKLSRYLYGVEFKPRDLRLALVEAASGRVGTALDRVLLTCFRWDPASRRYAFLFGALRAGAMLVFLALATLLFFLWRRELRGGAAA
jgi:protein SCO1/2